MRHSLTAPSPTTKEPEAQRIGREEQFANSVEVNGTRWTKIGAGRKTVYYRYFDTGSNVWHWSGSTIGVTNNGIDVGIPLDQVPIAVRRG
jgi:hypothetical protein